MPKKTTMIQLLIRITSREAAKKAIFLVVRPLREGGKGRATKKKKLKLEKRFRKKCTH